MTSTTPVASPSGPVSKLPLVSSPDSSVVTGQPGFAKQFQDIQVAAGLVDPSLATGSTGLIAGASSLLASDTSAVIGPEGGDQSKDGLTTLSKNWTALSGVVQGDHLIVSGPGGWPVDGLGQRFGGPRNYVAPLPDESVSVPQPASVMPPPTGGASVPRPISAAPHSDGSTSLAQAASVAPMGQPVPPGQAVSPASPLPNDGATVPQQTEVEPLSDGSTALDQPSSVTASGQAEPPALSLPGDRSSVQQGPSQNRHPKSGIGAISHDSGSGRSVRHFVRAATYSPKSPAAMNAPQGGRSARPSASATKAVAIPEQAVAASGMAAPVDVQPAPGRVGSVARPGQTRVSGANQGDRPNGTIERGSGRNASPATDPNTPIANVPPVAWLKQPAFPKPVQNLVPAAAVESGRKSSDGSAPAWDGLHPSAGMPGTNHMNAAAQPAAPLPAGPPLQSPVSSTFSFTIPDGFERPMPDASNAASAAPEAVVNRAGTEGATVAYLQFVQAAPADTGSAPPAVQSSTPDKSGQTGAGLDPRVAGAESGTPGKAETAPADLAVAVRVKAQTSQAASGQRAPAKEFRRVDLEDAPPAASLHTGTSRAGAWVIGEGPARGGPQPAAETASRPPERPEAAPLPAEEGTPRAAAPLKDLSLQVRQANQESVELRVVQREGELHVAVRTGDADLAHGLRQGLPELVDRLDQGGFRTEAWRPAGVVTAPEPSSQAHSRSSESQNPDSQSQSGWSQHQRGQRDHNQSNRPKWVEELEGNLAGGGERSTGEFHGFSR